MKNGAAIAAFARNIRNLLSLAAKSEPVSVTAAMRLMAERQWARAARMLRQLVAETDRGDLWMQYGHALKEAGLLSDAGRAYERARTVLGPTQDALMQVAHWNKVSGRFAAAEEFYLAAQNAAGEGPRPDLNRLMAPLIRLRPAPPATPGDDPHLFFSCASKLGSVSDVVLLPHELGRANYSYSFAMRGFQRAADALGLTWSFLAAPHYAADAGALTASRRPVHLAFYPPSQARLLKGARNILVFAWEFPLLPRAPEWAHAFSTPHHMLGLFEEIWVPCRYAAEVVGGYTDRPVRVVPSPILDAESHPRRKTTGAAPRQTGLAQLARIDWVPLAIFARLQGSFNSHGLARRRRLRDILPSDVPGRPAKIFLSVFNPHDGRKQILPMLQGFLEFARTEPEAVLLLKTTSPDDTNGTINQRLLERQVFSADTQALPLVSERVWITNAALTDAELDALYSLATFYLCTPYCEGQNLPVLEAMARGVVPVSPCHTAMADYLDDDNAIIIPHTLAEAPMPLQEVYRIWNSQTHLVSAADVVAALRAACRLGPAEIRAKAAAASARVGGQYGTAAFDQAITALLGGPSEAEAGA